VTEKPKAEKPKTRAELEQTIARLEASVADLSANVGRMRQACADEHARAERAEKREKETRAQFVDLKERLVTAEADNQRMRGYITRVQEDDVVREELIPVGDPAGEQRLVPKRKPENFCAPSPYKVLGASGGYAVTSYDNERRRAPAKHWVEY
jgi:hypothetical protein